jgi:hypothetical protein
VVLGQAGAQAALVANNLDHLCKTATAGVDMTTEVTDGTIISRIVSNSDTSLYVPATSNLTTAQAMAIDVHDTDLPAVKADTAAILLDTATIDTAGEIAAAVWSADATTYQTQGTFGQAIGDPVADANTIYKAVVTDATGATVGVDTAAIITDVAAVHVHAGTIETDVAAVHVHVGTIDGHITADYTATEKTAIDLLDDAAGGLADIHTDVADIHTDVVAVKGDTAAILLDTGTDGVLVSATGLTAINAEVVDVVATDVIADSIAAHEVRPTMRQALLMLYRFLLERSVSTTTVTVNKEDGSTSSYTLTLNDADAPTSITRAT